MVGIFAVFSTASVPGVTGLSPATPSQLKPSRVVADYLRSTGHEAFAAIQSLVYSGVIASGGSAKKFEVVFLAPDRFQRVVDSPTVGRIVLTLDGEAGWVSGRIRIVSSGSGHPETVAAKRLLLTEVGGIAPALVFRGRYGFTAAEEAKLRERRAVRLALRGAEGLAESVLFDAERHVPIAVSYRRPSIVPHVPSDEYLVIFSEHRLVGSIMVPFSWGTFDVGLGRFVTRTTVHSYTFNAPVEVSRFLKPS